MAATFDTPPPHRPLSMTSNSITRRQLLLGAAATTLPASTASWAQTPKAASHTRPLEIVQIVDVSAAQLDVSRDFLIGSRAAWQDINARGGIRGRPIQHTVIEVDGTPTGMLTALDTVRKLPQCIALSGTAGDRIASQLISLLRQEKFEIAHVAPWLHNDRQNDSELTFPIFATQLEQIGHALKSLSVVGVTELGAVYASAREYDLYHPDVVRATDALRLRLVDYTPTRTLQQLGQELSPQTPAIVLFIGGTPELAQFATGLERQARQRYVIGLADVNLSTMMQMGLVRNSPVMATQVVPMVTSGLPIVRAYRETLSRLFDEPPTPLSLSGFIAARYTQAVLQTMEHIGTRAQVLQAFQKRTTEDLGGFRVSFQGHRRVSAYVTQSMLTADGRIVG